MKETDTMLWFGTSTTAAEPHEDVDDLIFRAETDWYTSDR